MAQGATRIGATGASGGAVQAFYLGWVDERVSTAVMASPPPLPREAAASGCACDHIPGWPGPDPHVLAQWTAPTLWLADVEKPRPEGLSEDAVFEVLAGPHSYTVEMQVALDFREPPGTSGRGVGRVGPQFRALGARRPGRSGRYRSTSGCRGDSMVTRSEGGSAPDGRARGRGRAW